MKNLIRDLREACSLKRSYGSVTEATYVASLAKRLNPTMIDGAGNLHIDRRNGKSKTLFVAHTDTVSTGEGANPIIVEGDWWCSGPNSTLGADDGAGIALLLHLMRRRVPGYYVFCRGEEVGGLGSAYLAQEHSALLAEFDRAIAFDRKGVSSVITHQGGGRCCSDKFGEALAEALSTHELLYATDNTGVFTDTANFVEVISECTNLSCAYKMEHSDKERLNVKHLKMLAAQIVKVAWESLPTVRNTKPEPPVHTWRGSDTWDTGWMRNTTSVYDDIPLRSADDREIKQLTGELKNALELTKFGQHDELTCLLNKDHTVKIRVEKFYDAQYYIEELDSGADPYEILDEIFWEVR